MIAATTRARLLERYPMLTGLSADDLADLLAGASLLRVTRGTMMFDEQQPCRGFPLLLAGSVRIVKAAVNGRELHLYDVEPGDTCILTSGCLLGHAAYPARGEVRDDAEIVMLPAPAFQLLMARLEPFRDQVFHAFSARLAELMELVSAVAFQKLDQRLAKALLAKTAPIRITHQALADELGSVREIVSRLLKNFADNGWLRLGREQIEIVDADALRRYTTL